MAAAHPTGRCSRESSIGLSMINHETANHALKPQREGGGGALWPREQQIANTRPQRQDESFTRYRPTTWIDRSIRLTSPFSLADAFICAASSASSSRVASAAALRRSLAAFLRCLSCSRAWAYAAPVGFGFGFVQVIALRLGRTRKAVTHTRGKGGERCGGKVVRVGANAAEGDAPGTMLRVVPFFLPCITSRER